jgi:hypothetical protein
MAARTTRLTVASGPILEEFQSGQFRNDPGQQLGPWLSRAVPRRFSSRQKQPSELGEWDATGEIGTGRDAKCLPDNAEVASSILASPTHTAPFTHSQPHSMLLCRRRTIVSRIPDPLVGVPDLREAGELTP